MFKPRITVLRLMILVAVFGLVLGSGMYVVRCYRTWDYARRQVARLDRRIETLWTAIEWFKDIQDTYYARCRLYDLQIEKQEYEHLARHPWHGIPDEIEAK
jgi:hypothetical protein